MSFIIQHIRKMNEYSASLLLLLLVSSDIVFNGLHISKHLLFQDSSTTYDQITNVLDTYHLVKIFWIIVLFAFILKSTRCFGYVSWILVFTFFLVDDAFLIHQNIGDSIANSFEAYLHNSISLPYRLFELAVLAITGFFFLIILSWAYFRNSQIFRKISKDLMLFILALVFFGLIVDLATTIKPGPGIMLALDIIEDAGEMIFYSLILWYVFLIAMYKGNPDLFMLDFLRKPQT